MTSSAKQIPWARVFVEGVVIVASILLALALDAWWDGVTEREAGREYLIALHSELETIREELEGDQESRERRFRAMVELLHVTSSGASIPHDSANMLLESLWGAVRLNPPSGMFDLEASSSLVSSEEIRGGLLLYRQRLSRLMWQEERHQEAWERDLRPYLLTRTDALRHIPREYGITDELLPAPTHDPGLESVLRDRTFQNLLLNRLRRLSLASVNGDLVLEAIDELLASLEQELE